jgi:MarR family transcriptional repressor of emrRAB
MNPGKAESSRRRKSEPERTANLLGAAALAISGAADDFMSETGRRGQAANAALAILLQWPPRSIGDLARVLRRSHSATVRLIEELQADGLVTKHSGTDRRSIIVKLTSAGRREARGVLGVRGKVLSDVIAGLTPADRLGLSRILEKILTSLTPDRETCDYICRLCHLAACPQERCPVEITARAQAR